MPLSASTLPRLSRSRLTSSLAFLGGVVLMVCMLAGLDRLQLFDGKVEATGLWLVLPALAGLCLLGGAWSGARRSGRRAFNAVKAIDSIDEGYWVLDAEGRIVEVNDGYCRMMGYTRAQVMSRQIADFEEVASQPQIQRQINRILQTGVERFETRHLRSNGDWVDLEITVTRLDRRTLVAFLREISERKLAERRIHELAYYDVLTGLPNRGLLEDRFGQALINSERRGDHGAVLFVDLDNFKLINDTRGHADGDEVLVIMAERLRRCLRGCDSVARLGGDEFVVLLESLPACVEQAGRQAAAVAEKCRLALSRPYTVRDAELVSSASMGLTLFSGTSVDIGELMKRADTAMYQAKGAGRNRVVFYEPAMQQLLHHRTQLEGELRRALDGGQLRLFLQPQFDAQRRLTGAEMLLRWQHPQHGLVTPASFIPLAEETGLILPIGDWVLASACRLLDRWRDDEATCRLHLAVNVSVLQFSQPDFVDKLKALLDSSSFSSGLLQLELTESLVIRHVDDVVAKMHAIRGLGISLSMDDFGTGHSSLSNLRRLPLQQLKIDQSFVRNLPGNTSDIAIVRAIITMAQALGLEVVAEGVETAPQQALLHAHGCNSFQGFLFSRAVSVEEFSRQTRLGWPA